MARAATTDLKNACGGKFPGHWESNAASVLPDLADYYMDSVTAPEVISMTSNVGKAINIEIMKRLAADGDALRGGSGASSAEAVTYSYMDPLTPAIITRCWGALKTTTYRGATNINMIEE